MSTYTHSECNALCAGQRYILLFRALAIQAIDCHYIISDDDVTVCPEDRPLALAYMNLHNTILSLDIGGLIASVVWTRRWLLSRGVSSPGRVFCNLFLRDLRESCVDFDNV